MFLKIGVLKNFANFRKTTVLQSLFDEVAKPATLSNRDSNTGVFL